MITFSESMGDTRVGYALHCAYFALWAYTAPARPILGIMYIYSIIDKLGVSWEAGCGNSETCRHLWTALELADHQQPIITNACPLNPIDCDSYPPQASPEIN